VCNAADCDQTGTRYANPKSWSCDDGYGCRKDTDAQEPNGDAPIVKRE